MGMVEGTNIALIAGTAFTLLVFLSYLFGDNILYRWALALLAGSGVGYALGIALLFLFENWVGRQTQFQMIIIIPPVILGILLLLKVIPRFAAIGNITMGLLLGVGAAVAVSGALLGTLFPQMMATSANFSSAPIGDGMIVLVATVVSLLAFSPNAAKPKEDIHPILWWLYRLGRGLVIIALAVAFAGALTSGLTAFTERILAIPEAIKELMSSGG